VRFERRLCSALVLTLMLGGAFPASSQGPSKGPQTRPAPGGPGNRPARPNPGGGGNRPNPGGGGGNRPNPGGPGGPGGPSIQPPRPRPPRPQPPRPNPGNRPRPPQNRPPQWGRPPQNRPGYNFRPNDRDYLRRYYRRNLGYINRANRPRFAIGGFFPFGYIGYLTPLPPPVYGYLPPPPPGYQMGYYDGYVVVYDPVTYFIANVVDLLQ